MERRRGMTNEELTKIVPKVEILAKKPGGLEAIRKDLFQAADEPEIPAEEEGEAATLLLGLVEILD